MPRYATSRHAAPRTQQAEAERFARALSGESSLIQNRVTTNVGPLHPFGVGLAITYVQDQMIGFGFEVDLHACEAGETVGSEGEEGQKRGKLRRPTVGPEDGHKRGIF